MTTPVYGLFYNNTDECQMLAGSKESAKVMRTMFGAERWKYRLLTEAEANDPWVQAEVKDMQDAGVWS